MIKDKLCARMGSGAVAFAVAVRALAGVGPAAGAALRSLAAKPEVVRVLLNAELSTVGVTVVLPPSAQTEGAEAAVPDALAQEDTAREPIPAIEGPDPGEGASLDAAARTVPTRETSLPLSHALEGPDSQTAEQTDALAPVSLPQPRSPAGSGQGTETEADRSWVQDPEDDSVRLYEPDPAAARSGTADSAGLAFWGSFNNQTDYDPDLEALLSRSVTLAGDGSAGPEVLIIHTHGTESYTPCAGDDYEETDPFHTLEEGRNVTGLGTVLAETLREAGVGVVHACGFHDYPSYNGSYTRTAQDIQTLLARYPGIRLVIDLHRDSIQAEDGSWTATAADPTAGAKLLLVVGTDAGGLENPDWENNLALALQVQARMESEDLCRGINLRTERFNQQLAPTLLAELGACGDTWTQAEVTTKALGLALAKVLGAGSAAD